jgi:trehalose 6-phosphate phosphatase
MKHILSPRNVGILEQYARTNVLLAFDYDGTLSPIVRDPAKAKMRVRTRKALEQVAKRYPTAVISWRAREDVAALLGDLPLVAVLGSHGLESAEETERFERVVRSWTAPLQVALRGIPGVTIEDTHYSLAIHYRQSGTRRAAEHAIREAIERHAEDARVVGGKCVVNVIPAGAPHKGHALERLRVQTRSQTALYAGDDLTDEDVFELAPADKTLGIRVGRNASTRAAYYLRDQREVDLLLSHLARLRSESST